MIGDDDRGHLRRCVELAAEALVAGDEPFGSLLVAPDGRVRGEDHNRVAGGDATQRAVTGPVPPFDDEVHALHRRRFT